VDDVSGVEILVGDVGGGGCVGERLAEDVDGVDEGVDVVLFGGWRGAAQREDGERADLGQDVDEDGEQVGSDASAAAIAVPLVMRREGRDLLIEVVERGAGLGASGGMRLR
jgi:hypothetical protein